jgi:1,4-alpha-glucan branching enzyme
MLKREIIKQTSQVKVTFAIPHDPAQPRVSVVGEFNQWDPRATPLVKRTNNTRSASVVLDPGQRLRFRYYSQDGTWFNDDQADDYEPNTHGSQDCVVHT